MVQLNDTLILTLNLTDIEKVINGIYFSLNWKNILKSPKMLYVLIVILNYY